MFRCRRLSSQWLLNTSLGLVRKIIFRNVSEKLNSGQISAARQNLSPLLFWTVALFYSVRPRGKCFSESKHLHVCKLVVGFHSVGTSVWPSLWVCVVWVSDPHSPTSVRLSVELDLLAGGWGKEQTSSFRWKIHDCKTSCWVKQNSPNCQYTTLWVTEWKGFSVSYIELTVVIHGD